MAKKPAPTPKTDESEPQTDAEVVDQTVSQTASDEKRKKAEEVIKIKNNSDPTVAEPSTYQGIPLTPEEAAASDPAKHILADHADEDEVDEEGEVVKKGHITTAEEHLALMLKQPDSGVSKVKPGQQAPLQYANHKADNQSERSERIAQTVSDGVKAAVKKNV